MIQEIAGGQVASEIIDVYPSVISDFEVDVKYKNIDRLIGQEVPQDKIKTILDNLDIKIL